MITNTYKIILLYLLTIFICSCNKEVDILDDYKDLPIVYAVIDANDSISYIRIQKAFLSEGNLYEDAQISDSNLYNYKLDVSLKSGNRVINFDTITIKNKEEGTFFAPDYPIYYAITKNILNINQPLELEIRNPITGTIAKSTANLMDASEVRFIRPTHVVSLIESFKIDYATAKDIRIYQLFIRFHYLEMLPNDTSSVEYKYTELAYDPKKSYTHYGDEIISFLFRKQFFFETLLDPIHPTNELERYIGEIEIIVETTEQSFYTYYYSVNTEYTIIEHPKVYTNIENAYGIFAGKSSTNRFLRIDDSSQLYIRKIEGLNFIGRIPADNHP